MTKSVRCWDAERLMLDGEGRALTAEERRTIEEHVRECGCCRRFSADRSLMRGELAGAGWPAPADELVERTRRRMRQEVAEAAAGPAAAPVWVLVAMAVMTIVTEVWLAVSLAGVTADMALIDLPVPAGAAVFIIVQNAIMLLFAPVVLRAFRTGRSVAVKT